MTAMTAMTATTGTTGARVVLVDDQPLMRAAFRTILEAHGHEVVGEAADGDAAVATVRRTRPDVVLMDVRMPGRDGISATEELVAVAPSSPVLVLTTFDDDDVLDGALRAGAAGFLLKNSTPEELVRAVQRVAAGDAVLDPAVTRRVLARLPSSTDAHTRRAVESLTEREKDVLAALARGLTNAEIAGALGMSEATAKKHISHVLAKLGVRDRVQAAIVAYETGFTRDRR